MAKADRHPDGGAELETLPEWAVRPDLITIEGLAATGKGAISEALCERYGYRYLNISSIGRGLAVAFGDRFAFSPEEVSEEDYQLVVRGFYRDARIMARPEGMDIRVSVDGTEVTDRLHDPETGALAAHLMRFPEVPARVASFAQEFSREGNFVLDGRLVAGQIAPHADLHLFLKTDMEERIQRRLGQRQAAGSEVTESDIAAELADRDQKERVVGADRPSGSNSLEIDTTGRKTVESTREIVLVQNALALSETARKTSAPAAAERPRDRLESPWPTGQNRTGSHRPARPWRGR